MKKINILLFFFIILVINVFMLPQNALADKSQGTGGRYYCPLCEHRDDDDPLYKKERQFYKKIELIKKVYGDSIDEIVLAASVLHRYGRDDAYNILYTEDFDEAVYKMGIQAIKNAFKNFVLSEDEQSLIEANEKYDLLTLAAIVMNDSSNGGKYSDICFKQGLAGNKLVSNNKDGFFDNIFNNVVCTGVKLFGSNSAAGDNIKVKVASELIRLNNISNVCDNGYVGGLYSGVKDIKDEEKKQAVKESYAQQIIDFANYYKKLYSIEDDSCTYSGGNVGSGEMTNWRQCDERWGSKLFPGGSSICSVGCLATSMSYLIAKSGTQLTVPALDPGVFVDHTNYDGNLLYWDFSGIAPNFTRVEIETPVSLSNAASVLSNALNTPCGNNNQPFIVLYLDLGHYVALDHVEGNSVYVMDPSYDGDGLALIEDAWKGTSLHDYSVFCPSDVSFGSTGSTSSNSASSSDNCKNDDADSLEALKQTLGRLEGMLDETCTVRGEPGYVARKISADRDDVGNSTAYGITQLYGSELAPSLGYSNFDADMSNGCVEQSYIEQMAQTYMTDRRSTVQEYYEELSGGKKLEQYQYDALSLIHHHYPAGCFAIIEGLAKLDDVKSYEAYKLFLEYNGLGGDYGGIVRREVEFHMFYNGNYEAERDFSVDGDYMWTREYYNERVKVYNSENVKNYSGGSSVKPTKCVDGKAVGEEESKNASGLTGVVDCAKAQVGKAYIWGAAGPDTFDCSGLVTYCYNQALGVDISHYSIDQYYDDRFKDVSSESELVPGDILTLTYGNSGGHVAIYIGDGMMIHAVREGDYVREGTVDDFFSLSSDAKFRHYVG